MLAIGWPQLTNAQSITATIDTYDPCCVQITTTLPGLTVWILDGNGDFLEELAVPLQGGAPFCFNGNGKYQIEAYQFIQPPGVPAPPIVEVEIIGCPYEIFVDPDPEDPCCVSIYTTLPGLLNVIVYDENGVEVTTLTITEQATEYCFEENGNYTFEPTTCVCPDIKGANWPVAVDVSITECGGCDNEDLAFGCSEQILNVTLDGCELCFTLYFVSECDVYLLNIDGVIHEYPNPNSSWGYEDYCFQFPGEGNYEVSFATQICDNDIYECSDEPLTLCVEDCGPCDVEPEWMLECNNGYFCIKNGDGGSPNMEWIEPPFLDTDGGPTGHCQPTENLQNGDDLIFNIYTWVGETICTTTVNTVFDCDDGFGLPSERSDKYSDDPTPTDSQITISPNPSNDFININSSIGSDQILQILNADGKEIITKQMEGYNNRINTSSLSPGFYFVKITDTLTGENIHLEKIVIIK